MIENNIISDHFTVEELKKLGFIDVSKLFLVLYLKNGLYVVPFKKGDNINKVK
mgnify:CR=1 FL=1